MGQVIVFQNLDGSVGVIYPTQEGLSRASGDIHILALKDVPSGLPYKVLDTSDLPDSRTFRDAWEWDTMTVPDGVGHVSSTFEGVLQ